MFVVLSEKQFQSAVKVGTTPEFWEGAFTEEWEAAPVGAMTVLEDCAMVKVRQESTSTFNPLWEDYEVTHDRVQVSLKDLHKVFA